MSEFGEQLSVSPPAWRSAATLAGVAAVCTALVALTFNLTQQQIADNEQAWLEQSLKPAISGIPYDGDLTSAPLTIPAPHDLPGNTDVIIYRVIAEGSVVAALFVVTTPDGFVGPIRLLIGIDTDDHLTGVRILEHKETPGIGDLIDQSRTNWVDQFVGRSLASPAPELWAIRGDGGEFDQVTGASITPRAVIKAIKETLIYATENRDVVFATPAENTTETTQ